MRTSQRGIDLIREFEGFRAKAYMDQVGVWTIGYGHTEDVRPNDEISQKEAAELLREDLVEAEYAVNSIGRPLTQNQFDALVSLVFNVGRRAVAPLSTIGVALRAGDFDGAGKGILLWNRAGRKVVDGLRKRREREKALWDTVEV